jgi:hypothetical protein
MVGAPVSSTSGKESLNYKDLMVGRILNGLIVSI